MKDDRGYTLLTARNAAAAVVRESQHRQAPRPAARPRQ